MHLRGNTYQRLTHLISHLHPSSKQQQQQHQFITMTTTTATRSASTSLSSIYQKLEVKVIPPVGTHKSTLIWMHGLGDSSAGFQSMFEMMAPKNTKIILPNAPMRPITVNDGYVMRGWYDIVSLNDRLEEHEDKQGIYESCEMVHQLLDNEFAETDRVVCGGFSQGAAMTLASVLSYEKHKLEAMIIGSGYALLGKSLLGSRYQSIQDNVPIYIFHGKMDQVVSYQYAMKSFNELLEKRGETTEVFIEKYQGHEISDDEYAKISELIEKHCS